MGKAYERYKNAAADVCGKVSGAAAYDEFPELSTFLAGVPKPDLKGWELEPQTITLWLEADMVHFCIGRTNSLVKLFGSFQDLSQGLQGVEDALGKGHFSERKAKVGR